MNKRWVWIAVFLLGLGLAAVWLVRPNRQAAVTAALEAMPAAQGTFARVVGPVPLDFPKDHGPHPNYQTEWWYYTGNLEGPQGERFGFQLTFFRRALSGPDIRADRDSAWATDQVYLAHFALTDGRGDKFYAFERLERGAAGLAGAAGEGGLRVWLHDWRVEQTGKDTYRLFAADDQVQLALDLTDLKGPVLQGDRGYSRKGPQDGNASIYFSQTRMEAVGTVTLQGKPVTVRGQSWMDHEYSTSALSAGQVGWDWFSMQLDDGSELMVYTIRRDDGRLDPFSKGSIISPDGDVRVLSAADFHITVEKKWTSPRSGGTYPAAWSVSIPSEELSLEIRPIVADQELNLSFIYWEGAVDIAGMRGGQPVTGRGYVELTGYAQSLEGRF